MMYRVEDDNGTGRVLFRGSYEACYEFHRRVRGGTLPIPEVGGDESSRRL